jgi:hypothetical protein
VRRVKDSNAPRKQGGLAKTAEGSIFVRIDVEDGKQFGELQEIVDLFGKVQEFQIAAALLHGREGGHQFTAS